MRLLFHLPFLGSVRKLWDEGRCTMHDDPSDYCSDVINQLSSLSYWIVLHCSRSRSALTIVSPNQGRWVFSTDYHDDLDGDIVIRTMEDMKHSTLSRCRTRQISLESSRLCAKNDIEEPDVDSPGEMYFGSPHGCLEVRKRVCNSDCTPMMYYTNDGTQ